MLFPIDTINLLMLNAGYAELYADWNWKNVCSPFTRLYYVTEGEAWLDLPYGKVHLLPGFMYIIPAQTTHSYECYGTFKHYYIHLYMEEPNEGSIFDYYSYPEAGVEASGDEEDIFKAICAIHPEAVLPSSDPYIYDNSLTFAEYVKRANSLPDYSRMNIRGLLLVLFSRLQRYSRPKTWTSDARMSSILKFIRQHIGERIGTGRLAEAMCLSDQHVIRLFRRNFNETPMQFVTRKKMERAELLLLTTDKPIKGISYELGFSDLSYFIRLFKKTTGKTPLDYRRDAWRGYR